MARKTGNISILQFDEQLISWLRVKPSTKGVEVLAYQTVRGPWSPADGGYEQALQAFIKENRIADDRVCTMLPRHTMTARIINLPSHSDEEIDGMVRLSVEEYVPFPEHELVIDQCVLQRLSDGHSRVLAVFAHRDVVEEHVAVLRACGIEPDQIYVSTACLASAAVLARPGEDERFALLQLASGGLEVVVLRGNRLEYGRGVATTQDWTALASPDGAEALEELHSELRATLSTYRRESEDGLGVDRVYVCSEWADASGAASALSETAGYECLPARFAQNLCAQGADRLSGFPLASLGAALAAQGRGPVSISLVPASLVRARRRSENRRQLMRVGGLVLAILVGLLALYGQAAYQRSRYIKELQSRIDAIEPLALNVETKRRQLIRLQQHLDRRGSALELLAKLSALTPPQGLNITRFTFVHGEGITVAGRAEALAQVDALSAALREAGREDMPQFARAGMGPTKAESEQNQPVMQYEINIPFVEKGTGESGGEAEP